MSNQYPQVLAAAQALETNQWALGDALVAECDNDKSLTEAVSMLKSYGIDYEFNTLRQFRDVSRHFPVDKRLSNRSWSIHHIVNDPDILAEIEKQVSNNNLTVAKAREMAKDIRRQRENAAREVAAAAEQAVKDAQKAEVAAKRAVKAAKTAEDKAAAEKAAAEAKAATEKAAAEKKVAAAAMPKALPQRKSNVDAKLVAEQRRTDLMEEQADDESLKLEFEDLENGLAAVDNIESLLTEHGDKFNDADLDRIIARVDSMIEACRKVRDLARKHKQELPTITSNVVQVFPNAPGSDDEQISAAE